MRSPKFLADENIAAPLVYELRNAGWDTAYVAETMSGMSDESVLQWSIAEGRILLTEDKDFGELVFRTKRNIPGVLMLRMPGGPWPERWVRLRVVLEQYADRLVDSFVVVGPTSVRRRSIP